MPSLRSMHKNKDLTNRVAHAWYNSIVGVAHSQSASTTLALSLPYSVSMILEANMSEEEIDEAIGHLSAGIRQAIDQNRKQALMSLIDALLDAKLEKKQ
jgi:hypothetical protein